MTISATILDAMLAAGCTAEQIAAYVKTDLKQQVAVYVYVIAPQDDDSPVKVGVSDNPWYRRLALEAGSPVRLRMVGVVECSDRYTAMELERRYHDHAVTRRLHGEWFDVNCDSAMDWLQSNHG